MKNKFLLNLYMLPFCFIYVLAIIKRFFFNSFYSHAFVGHSQTLADPGCPLPGSPSAAVCSTSFSTISFFLVVGIFFSFAVAT